MELQTQQVNGKQKRKTITYNAHLKKLNSINITFSNRLTVYSRPDKMWVGEFLSRVMKKTVFGASEQGQTHPGYNTKEDGLRLERFIKRELICLLLFTCNYVVSVWRGFLFLWVLGMGFVILLWHSLSLPLIILKFRI